MKITKRQLKRIIREEYSKLQRRGLINEMYDDTSMMENNHDVCVQKCFAVIPSGMKQMCRLGRARMVTNDIYHLCAPICEQMGCDCDEVSAEVEKMCCR